LRLHNFIVLFGTLVIVITFLVALAFLKKEKPRYCKFIFIFIVLGLLLSVNTIASNNYTWLYSIKVRILIEQILILLQSLMFSFFFLEVLKKSIFAEKIKILIAILIPIQIGLIIVVQFGNTEIRPSIVPNLILLIFCYFYLRDLLNNKPTIILVRSPAFWLVMGFLFSSCIGFPVSSLIPFVSKSQEYTDLRFQIFSIHNMSLVIMYLFFIKSYLCLKRPQNL
jgi:hypothetical protein